MNKNNSEHVEKVWDLAVIGGGPAGMMAAGRAAERGAKVILIEKNATLGKKLLITGGGRCNVTNAEFDNRKLLEKFKDNNKYLFSAFSQWSVKETLDFFHNRNMETKTEALQRVFPVSDKSQSVWNTLVNYLKEGGVEVISKSPVVSIEGKDGLVSKIHLKNKKEIQARSVVIATGGKSHPETGSTGDGFTWLQTLGHSVREPTASLVPIKIKDAWVKRLSGVTLQDVKITIFQNNTKQGMSLGRLLFTHFGVSGPTILNLSQEVSELLKYGDVTMFLDIFPKLDYGMLNTKLQEIFKEHSNKKIKNSLANLVPSALVPAILKISKIDEEKWSHSVTQKERLHLVKVLKTIPLHIEGLLGTDKAIVTSGGVSLDEIDFKTMRSRLFPNLYLIGDILDIDRPSGGYSLQLCWTTGYVAGNSVKIS